MYTSNPNLYNKIMLHQTITTLLFSLFTYSFYPITEAHVQSNLTNQDQSVCHRVNDAYPIETIIPDVLVYDHLADKVTKPTNESHGDICFTNANMYSRSVIITHRDSQKEYSLLIGKGNLNSATTECLYEIPSGVYECKVYTTFTKKMIENFNLRVKPDKELVKELNLNGSN